MIRRSLRSLILLACLLAFCSKLQAQNSTLTGTLATPNFQAVSNSTLTFTLSQAAIQAGLYSVATSPVNCYTSIAGNIVGLPDPQTAPILSLVGGSLGAGTYYVSFSYWISGLETLPSPTAAIVLAAPGGIQITAPAQLPRATGYNVYIGTTSTNGTRQIHNTGWASTSQTTSISAGLSPALSNSTICLLFSNDSLIPAYTTYRVGVLDRNGNTVGGFPQDWYLISGTVDITQQYPIASNVRVRFPQPIIANPPSIVTQSLNSPLTLNGFTLTSGALVLPNNASPPSPTVGQGLIYADNSSVLHFCSGASCATLGGASFPSLTDNTIPVVTATTKVLRDSDISEDDSGGPGLNLVKINSRLLVNGTSSDVNTSASTVNLGAIVEANSPTNAQTIMIEALGGGGGAILDSSHTGGASTKDLWFTFDFFSTGAPPAMKFTTNGVLELVKSYAGGTLSDAGTVALRNNAGTLEKSENGGAWGAIGGGGGGTIGGSCASINRLPKMVTNSTTIACSNVTDNGSTVVSATDFSSNGSITANSGLFGNGAPSQFSNNSSAVAAILNTTGGATTTNLQFNVNSVHQGDIFGFNTGQAGVEISAATGTFLQVTNSSNIGLGSAQYGNMVGGVSIGLATTAPTSNPAFGFLFYVDPADNKLKARGSGGTVTILANP